MAKKAKAEAFVLDGSVSLSLAMLFVPLAFRKAGC